VWNATRGAGDTRTIVATSPAHSGHPAFDPQKNGGRPPLARPDAGSIFSFDAHAGSPPSRVDGTTLETMLASLDARFGDVTAVIPNRWDFFDGEVSDGILDGGYDMFDGGNYLSTNFGGFIPYSNGVITTGSFFGVSGATHAQVSRLFVLVADPTASTTSRSTGTVGADGQGVDGAILDVRTAGASFRGFVNACSARATVREPPGDGGATTPPPTNSRPTPIATTSACRTSRPAAASIHPSMRVGRRPHRQRRHAEHHGAVPGRARAVAAVGARDAR
jgi:hypothetical protein